MAAKNCRPLRSDTLNLNQGHPKRLYIEEINIIYRHPNLEDGLEIYQLITASPPLDVNSQYYYHIICHDFSNTCVIVENDHKIRGFISGYLKPDHPSTLFIWQVAVAPEARGKKLASTMLEWLTKQPTCNNITVLETTISSSNQASQNLFTRFADRHNAGCETSPFLDTAHFGDQAHEDEILYRISFT